MFGAIPAGRVAAADRINSLVVWTARSILAAAPAESIAYSPPHYIVAATFRSLTDIFLQLGRVVLGQTSPGRVKPLFVEQSGGVGAVQTSHWYL